MAIIHPEVEDAYLEVSFKIAHMIQYVSINALTVILELRGKENMSPIENPLEIIKPDTAMADAVSTAFGIREYLDIINSVKDDDFNADISFRKKFNAYY